MFIDNYNHQFVVRFRFAGENKIEEKIFKTEHQAYEFYHSLDKVDFRCFKIKTTVISQIVVLYEKEGSNALKEVNDG